MDQNRSEKAYVSPDGALTFMVVREAGDISLGFRGGTWHTHGDILAGQFDLPVDDAVAAYVAALTSNQAVVALSMTDGRLADIWIPDDPGATDAYQPQDEAVTFRYWDGTVFEPVAG